MLHDIAPVRRRILGHRYFAGIRDRTLTLGQAQAGLYYFYPLIQMFPQFMAVNLSKVPLDESPDHKRARDWLLANISVERQHTKWWRQWAIGFDVDVELLNHTIHPPPEIDALNNYLWTIAYRGTLAEGIGATNFAIEGVTGEWTVSVRDAIADGGIEGRKSEGQTMAWLDAHAQYDDTHPAEALELMKSLAVTPEEQANVARAVKRSLEYFLLGMGVSYELGRIVSETHQPSA
jgi:pyrroloquinoline quinone (PQQ) biosynthesis protein C